MSPRRSNFPARVALIAVSIVVVFGVLFLALNRLGNPAAPEPQVTPDETIPTIDPAAEQDGASDPLAAAVQTERVTLQLFLVDMLNQRLMPRYRRIEAPMTIPAQAQAAIERLISTREIGFLSPLPPGTRVREVWVSPGGIAYVDFDAGLTETLAQSSLAEIYAVYGVIGTLTASFPEINKVQFLIAGQPVDTMTGHLDLSLPLGPLADWLY